LLVVTSDVTVARAAQARAVMLRIAPKNRQGRRARSSMSKIRVMHRRYSAAAALSRGSTLQNGGTAAPRFLFG
jgi:hypothetical protein